MSAELCFLVVDGYAKAGREDLESGGATTAGRLYEGMLERWMPSARIDILYPADPGAALPAGAAVRQYDGIAWTGSSLTVYDQSPEVTAQVEFAKEVFAARVPSFGSCWAAQIAAVASGGYCAGLKARAYQPRERVMRSADMCTRDCSGNGICWSKISEENLALANKGQLAAAAQVARLNEPIRRKRRDIGAAEAGGVTM